MYNSTKLYPPYFWANGQCKLQLVLVADRYLILESLDQSLSPELKLRNDLGGFTCRQSSLNLTKYNNSTLYIYNFLGSAGASVIYILGTVLL